MTQKIELLFDLNKYTECIELCLKHLNTNEVALHTLYNYLIFSYYNLKKYEEAFKFCDMAIGDYPDIDTYLYSKSLVLVAQNKPKLAHDYIKKALSSDPQNAKYYALYSHILLTQNKAKLAKEMIEKALELDSNDLDFHIEHALVLYESNKAKEAKQIINDILKEDPFHKRALDIKQTIFTSNLSDKKSILSGLLLQNPFDKNYQKDLKFINFYYRFIPFFMLFTIWLSYLFHVYRKELGFLEFWLIVTFVIVGGIGSRDWRFNIPFVAIMLAINMYFTKASESSYFAIIILAPLYSFIMYSFSYFAIGMYLKLKDKNNRLKKVGINQVSYFLFQYPFETDDEINQKALKDFYIIISTLMVISLGLFYLYPYIKAAYGFLKIPLILLFLVVAIKSAKNFLLTILYTFFTILIINNFECKDGLFWCLFTAIFISPLFLAMYNYINNRKKNG